jgi:hypothetical protein
MRALARAARVALRRKSALQYRQRGTNQQVLDHPISKRQRENSTWFGIANPKAAPIPRLVTVHIGHVRVFEGARYQAAGGGRALSPGSASCAVGKLITTAVQDGNSVANGTSSSPRVNSKRQRNPRMKTRSSATTPSKISSGIERMPSPKIANPPICIRSASPATTSAIFRRFGSTAAGLTLLRASSAACFAPCAFRSSPVSGFAIRYLREELPEKRSKCRQSHGRSLRAVRLCKPHLGIRWVFRIR